eukprot:TRINITY_DN70301_c0_g1_i1.p1 TRINITY_DN70301_c0_g1~~TRINITY_DN70301_c0_g1_i1.p1  ORF type:complete len:807 (+),score=169.95 TRINITY_DN70301_c0_g1_i1:99-2423(+)
MAGNIAERACAALVGRSLRPGDTPDAVRSKAVAVPVYAMSAVLALAAFAALQAWEVRSARDVAIIVLAAASGGSLLPSLLLSPNPFYLSTAWTALILGAVVVLDWHGAGEGAFRFWPLSAALADLVLLRGEGTRLHTAAAAAMLLWLVVERVEAATRGGVYEALRWGDAEYSVCGCLEPPCAVGWGDALVSLAAAAVVLVTDCALARGVRTTIGQQEAAVGAAIGVSEVIADMLVHYRTEEAARLVNGEEGERLPPGLRNALGDLLANLQRYRPFLPQSVLHLAAAASEGTAPDEESRDRSDRMPPPLTVHPSSDEGEWAAASSPLWPPHSLSGRFGSPLVTVTSEGTGGSLPRFMSIKSDGAGSRSSIAELLKSPKVVAVTARFQKRSVSLVVANSTGYLAHVHGAAHGALSDFHEALLTRLTDEVQAVGAITDWFSAGRFQASLNAARPVTQHRLRAARLAWAMTRPAPAVSSQQRSTGQGTSLVAADGGSAPWTPMPSPCRTGTGLSASTASRPDRSPAAVSAGGREFMLASPALGAHPRFSQTASDGGLPSLPSPFNARVRIASGVGSQTLAQLPITTGVASGDGVCGFIGCAAQQTYSITSAAATWVHHLERLALAWNCSVAVNGPVADDAAHAFVMRFRETAVLPRLRHTTGTVQQLWEVVEAAAVQDEQQEWMYQLEAQCRQSEWIHHNEARIALSRGDIATAKRCIEAGRRALAETPGPSSGLLAELYDELDEAARHGAPHRRMELVPVMLAAEHGTSPSPATGWL